MRYTFLFAAALGLLTPGLAGAQQIAIAKIEKVRVGFRPYNENVNFGRYKVGLWAPVYVEITAGPNGLGIIPGDPKPYLKVETPDFEDVGTIYYTPVMLDRNETGVFLAYTKTGNGNGEIKVTLHVGNRTIHPPPERDLPMDIQAHLYLTLGRRISDLPIALLPKEKENQNDLQFQDDRRKGALFEDKADLLPTHWFGYDGVDLMFLSADNREFLTKLADGGHAEQLKALAQWVRRGGRLVIPMAKQSQDLVANLLTKPAWQPAVPVVPPVQTADKFVQPERLTGVETWGEINNMPFPAPGEKPPSVAQLEPANVQPGDWEVLARVGTEGAPLIARVPYGLGQIIYFAFSLDDPAFGQWQGRHEFLRKAVAKLSPRTGQDIANQPNQPRGGIRQHDAGDVSSQLYNALDNFDVRIIPFGIVALFIVLYVVVVGPLEFFLLKYLFGRLEWTWITFPAVVLAVSIIAYFGAYALKGQDLKVNKVDIVDFDLRTDADAQRQGKMTRVFGQTFLMILSPRIQSYTVGIEPNPEFWGAPKAAQPLTADLVSWMARADEGPGGFNRGGTGQGFFRKPYYYGTGNEFEESLPSGVSGVPIPVWMAKAFGASWEATSQTPPVVAELSYHRNPVGGKDVKITGTLKSNLAVELVDAWLFYADHAYPIEGGIPAAADQPLKIFLEDKQKRTPGEWANELSAGGKRESTSQGMYDPSGIVKRMLFHEKLDQNQSQANHSLRRLDLSWRLYKEPPRGLPDRSTREAILVARAKFLSGSAAALSGDPGQPLPTRLWLGRLPEMGGEAPSLPGFMNQDTFVRIILPVRPAGN
jgi:hypothetical protein